ncbi:helix-turn-helix domain-containing protein [Paraburkholderia mimosarum]|uniref:helix-turn-helix domain-containing protein n=1 Tax=Paraburkholderia mimosarum TaxID=312026 RepID=UPI0039C34FEB
MTEWEALADQLAHFERMLVENTLRRHHDDVARAVDELGIPKKTLYHKLCQLRIVAPDSQRDDKEEKDDKDVCADQRANCAADRRTLAGGVGTVRGDCRLQVRQRAVLEPEPARGVLHQVEIDSSVRISEINGVIEGIAFQTNILVLNGLSAGVVSRQSRLVGRVREVERARPRSMLQVGWLRCDLKRGI